MTHVANVLLEAPAAHLWGNVSSHWLKEIRDQLGPGYCDIHIHAPGTQVEFASLSRATYYYVNRLDCTEKAGDSEATGSRPSQEKPIAFWPRLLAGPRQCGNELCNQWTTRG